MADYGTDQLLLDIADYVVGYEVSSRAAVKTARYAILDAVGCALLSLNYPECVKLLGPIVPGAAVKHGAHVIGTTHDVDPVTAAHGCATATRWLDYNDAWLGAEWVHPSDVVGAILPLAEYLSRVRMERNLPSLTMKDVVVNAIKAYEVVGILALENSLNQIGVDHIMMTRVAVAAVATAMLGGGRREVANAVSNAFADGAGCARAMPTRPVDLSRFLSFPFLSLPSIDSKPTADERTNERTNERLESGCGASGIIRTTARGKAGLRATPRPGASGSR